MTRIRRNHLMATLTNGTVFLAGGFNSGAPENSAELFDPSTGKFTATGSMSATSCRTDPNGVLLQSGKVFVAGGNGCGVSPEVGQWTSEIYDPLAGTFGTPVNQLGMGGKRSASALLTPSGKVLLVGGGEGGWTNDYGSVYTPSSNTFGGPSIKMSMGRRDPVAVALPNDKVLVAGGSGFSLPDTYRPAEVFDLAAGSFTAAGTSASVHSRLTSCALLLPSNPVLFTGANAATEKTELYNPSTKSWSAGTSLKTKRYGHTCTLLASGKVLLTGGTDETGAMLSSVELY